MKNIKSIPTNCHNVYLIVSIFIGIAIGFSSCEKREPIKIGFSATLTGGGGEFGTRCRNAAQFAVDEINHNGGIKGRQILLISKDDKNNPDAARKVDQELIDEGVVAIVGHPTSSMSLASVSLINEKKMLMISPIASAPELTGIDDYFLRVIPDNRAVSRQQALYVHHNLKAKNVACVIDLSNKGFTMTYFDNFKTVLEQRGTTAVHAVTYTTGPNNDYGKLADRLLSFDPDCVFIITNAMDAAMICQHLAKRKYDKSKMIQGWALAEEFITNSGKSSEGVIVPVFLDLNSTKQAYLSFKERFTKYYKGERQWSEILTYETIMVLKDALTKAEIYTPDELKKQILAQKNFHGLQKDFSIDPYGDGERDVFWLKVADSQFKSINE
ncbi:MAG: ABC transporter substrate-binding protein [Desulfobacteraceae bacterium]|jgi:branched-chain amino acid transport system substrate-binding protein